MAYGTPPPPPPSTNGTSPPPAPDGGRTPTPPKGLDPEHGRHSQHKAERIVAGLVERFFIRKELLLQYAQLGGRPLFGYLPTDKEQWEWWQDPEIRREMILGIQQKYGVEEVGKYVEHMARIDRKLHRNGKEEGAK